MTDWCARKKKEFAGLSGVYLGVAGCYNPNEHKICLGKEIIINIWMRYEEAEATRFLINILCHEEDHRVIHEVTMSKKAALAFDYLFHYPFDFKTNREYFKVAGDFNLLTEDLSSYGKIIYDLYHVKSF